MDKSPYQELTDIIEQMINDKVQLIHGGQIINWDDTRIPEILQEIKGDYKHFLKNIPIENNDN